MGEEGESVSKHNVAVIEDVCTYTDTDKEQKTHKRRCVCVCVGAGLSGWEGVWARIISHGVRRSHSGRRALFKLIRQLRRREGEGGGESAALEEGNNGQGNGEHTSVMVAQTLVLNVRGPA